MFSLIFLTLFSFTLVSAANFIVYNNSNPSQTPYFVVNGSTGNIGIGTPSPARLLDLVSSAGVNAEARISSINVDTAGTTANASLQLQGNWAGSFTVPSSEIKNIPTGAGQGTLAFFTRDGSSTLERVRIDKDGNVGIGTTSPETLLDIGNINVGIKSQYGVAKIESTDAQLDIVSSNAGEWGSSINLIEGNGGSNTNVWSIVRQAGQSGDSSLRFNYGTTNSHVNINKFTIQTSGNVGIGNTTPLYKLEVNGVVNAHGYLVNGSALATGSNVSGTYVPYTGATNNVDLGNYNLSTGGNLVLGSASNITIGSYSPAAAGFDMRIGINTNVPGISGLDFKNSNSGGQVRLMARNNQDDYLVLNIPGSSVSGTWFGRTRSQTAFVWSTASTDTDKALAIGTLNAGDLILGTDDTARVTIGATSGNVGIGTTTPSRTLDVRGVGNFSGTVYINNGTDLSTIISGSGVNVWNLSGNNLYPRSLGYNIGIGTQNPTALLDVEGEIVAGTSNSGSYLIRSQNTTPDRHVGLGVAYYNTLSESDGVRAPFIQGQSNNRGNYAYYFGWAGIYANQTASTNANDLLNATNAKLYIGLATNGNTYFNAGNVGIGTTTPGTALDIYDSTSTTSSSTGTTLLNLTNYVGTDLSQQKTFIDFNLLDNNANFNPQVRIGAEVGRNADADNIDKEGAGAFVVYTSDGSGGSGGGSISEKFRIGYNGNVGIGTTNPQGKLTVQSSGTIGSPNSVDYGNAYILAYDGSNRIGIDPNQIITDSSTLALQNSNGAGTISFYAGASASPQVTLNATGSFIVTAPSTGPAIVVGRAGGQANIKAGSDNYLVLDSSGQYVSLNHYVADDVILTRGGGNVGIGGIVSPSYKLDVNGTINAHGYLVNGSALATGSNVSGTYVPYTGATNNLSLGDYNLVTTNGQIRAGSADGVNALVLSYTGSTDIGQVNAGGANLFLSSGWNENTTIRSGDEGIAFQTTNDGNYVTRMVIQHSNGYVGIGRNVVPTSLFHVTAGTTGDAVFTLEADTDNNNENDNPWIYFRQDSGLVEGYVGLAGDTGSAFGASISGGSSNALILATDNLNSPIQLATSNVTRLTVDGSSGNIGIGTSDPQSQLHVYRSGEDATPTIYLSNSQTGSTSNGSLGILGFGSAEGEGYAAAQIRGYSSGDFNDNDWRAGLKFLTTPDGTATPLERLIITDTGNIGIGTTAPSSPLHVNSSADQLIQIQSSDSLAYIRLLDTDDSLYFGTKSQKGFFGGVADLDSTNLVVDLVNGNVGIGNSTPLYKLEVGGVVNAHGYLVNGSALATGSNVSGTYVPYTGATNNITFSKGQEIRWGDSSDTIGVRDNPPWLSSYSNVVTFKTFGSGAWTFYDSQNSQVRATILASGNIGIGTTSPPALLSLGSNSYTTSTPTANPVAYLQFDNTYDSSGGANANKIIFYNSSASQFGIGVSRNDFDLYTGSRGNFKFWVNHNVTNEGDLALIVNSSGNVGVNTDSPQAKLHVQGDVILNASATSGNVVIQL